MTNPTEPIDEDPIDLINQAMRLNAEPVAGERSDLVASRQLHAQHLLLKSAAIVAARGMLRLDQTDDLAPLDSPAVVLRLTDAREDRPHLSIEWRDKPTPGEVLVIAETLLNPLMKLEIAESHRESGHVG